MFIYLQLLLRMPTVNRRTFVFLITFLKKLLHFTHENEMDAKLLGGCGHYNHHSNSYHLFFLLFF